MAARPAAVRTSPITRHKVNRLIGLVVIVLATVVGIGAGFVMPGRTSEPVTTLAPSAAAAIATVAPAASAPAPIAANTERYLAPTGSDANPGTIEAPWATLSAAVERLEPGQTLWVRGGTYRAGEVDWARSGTASAPITVRGYPGEPVVFDGASSHERFLWFHAGAGFLVLRDIRVLGYNTAESGVIAVSDGAHDLTFQGIEIDGNRGGTTQDHLIYLSAPGVHDITIAGCTLAGISGAAIHVYHDPAATNIRIDGNRIADAHWGIMLYSGTSNVMVTGNRFTDVDVAVRLEKATAVSLLDNVASGQAGIQVVGPPIQAQYVDEGNTWPAPLQTVSP